MAIVPGNGSTVSFASSGLTLGILSISIGGMSRPVIDISTMATATEREKMAGTLVDPGEVTIEMLMDGEVAANTPEFLATATGAVVITFGSDNDTFTSSGIASGLEMNIPMDDRMTATMTIALHGATAFNAVA